MQKFESWFDCLTLKILMQWGKIFLPIPAQYLLQESSKAERCWAAEAVGILVCDHGLSCPFTKDCCLWNSFWVVTLINQNEEPDGDFSGRGPPQAQHISSGRSAQWREVMVSWKWQVCCSLWLSSTCTAIFGSQSSQASLKMSLGDCLSSLFCQQEVSLVVQL